MKCSHCGLVMGQIGFVVTLVSLGPKSYTAVLHDWCVSSLLGHANERRLTRVCVDAGWSQTELPGFAETPQEARLRAGRAS